MKIAQLTMSGRLNEMGIDANNFRKIPENLVSQLEGEDLGSFKWKEKSFREVLIKTRNNVSIAAVILGISCSSVLLKRKEDGAFNGESHQEEKNVLKDYSGLRYKG